MRKKQRKSFASIQIKKNCQIKKFNFCYLKKINKSSSNTLIAKKILNLFSPYLNKIYEGTGEWNWLQQNKQKKFIEVILKKNSFSLSLYLTNMFRNEATYGYLSPSFSDCTRNKKQVSSDILNNIDTCLEFTDLLKISNLTNNVGNPYGLKLSTGFVLPDTPRHYYYAHNIFNLIKEKINPYIVEIGGGYGGSCLQLWKRFKGKVTIINIDLLSGIIVTYFFLKKNGVPVNIVYKKSEVKENMVNLIVFENQMSLKKIIPKCHLIFNSRSLCEMSKDSIKFYFDYINNSKCKFFYHENSNYLMFPNSKRHLEIMSDDFPINKKIFSLQTKYITPFTGGDGRYREYVYKSI